MASGERQSQLAALATVKRLLAKDSERTSFWRECFREADAMKSQTKRWEM